MKHITAVNKNKDTFFLSYCCAGGSLLSPAFLWHPKEEATPQGAASSHSKNYL